MQIDRGISYIWRMCVYKGSAAEAGRIVKMNKDIYIKLFNLMML